MEAQNLSQVSEIKLCYHSKVKASQRKQIATASDVYDIVKNIPEMAQNIEYKELFYILYLNQANRVLSALKVSEGGTCSTVVDIKHLMQGAILQNAQAIIICHNHPSGNLIASQNDINMARKIKTICDFFTIQFLDSVIISSENYYSFAVNGLI
ncbi:JAB domain-containing protein [Bacteroidales bacterium OttesenSCG-928-B11]|nr:JAB domain-containing protein [Bacteroidales bacterium OttesenSCG-928-B11]